MAARGGHAGILSAFELTRSRNSRGAARSERRLCEEVHLNLAYRWFCRLGLDGAVPDHSTFSKNRHGRFRESDLLRKLFESTVARCTANGLVGGEGFAVGASMIKADANRCSYPAQARW
jgi:transposase